MASFFGYTPRTQVAKPHIRDTLVPSEGFVAARENVKISITG
jgi:hypothetical protein